MDKGKGKEIVVVEKVEKIGEGDTVGKNNKRQESWKQQNRAPMLKGKENIPTEDNKMKKQGVKRRKDGHLDRDMEGGDLEKALVVFESPPRPIIREFLEDSLSSKEISREDGDSSPKFQRVKKKMRRNPTPNGGEEEQGMKGKVQRLCLEWDSKISK